MIGAGQRIIMYKASVSIKFKETVRKYSYLAKKGNGKKFTSHTKLQRPLTKVRTF
jgi:hypothetical protein